METKNIENNFSQDEFKNSLKNLGEKKEISSKDIDNLIGLKLNQSKDFIKNREDELKWSFEIVEFLSWLWDKEVSWIDNILSKYLNPKNNIA